MTRYFFHLEDGVSLPDREGTELPDLDAARVQAVKHFGELLRLEPERFWQGEEWTMTVTDADGLTQFSLFFGAVLAPAIKTPRAVPVMGR